MTIHEEQRPAVEPLDEREQRYRSLFQYNPDAIFSVDRTPRFTSANPAAERISGYSAAELLAIPPNEIIAPESLETLLQAYRRSLQGEPIVVEIAVRRKDGARVELSVTLVPILVDGAVTGLFGIAKDVTDQRRAEAERATALSEAESARARAEQAEQRASFLAQAGELLGSSLDYETTLSRLVDLAVPQLADWCAVDVLDEGGAVRRLAAAFADPVHAARLQALRQRYPRDPQAAHGVNAVIRTGMPEFLPVVNDRLFLTAARDQEHLTGLRELGASSLMRVPLAARGRTFGAISLSYAESGRHYGRGDLDLAMDLAHRAATAVDNARLYSAAQHAVELRDQFLAAASHDLRTPVTAIKSYAQLLQRSVARAEGSHRAPPSADLREGLTSIERAASRITEQINELLDLSRLQSGRPLELERRPTDLVALLQQAVAAQEQITGRQIRVEAAVPHLIGLWDNVRLERVLNNLLSNAVKYSPTGDGVLVRVGPASGYHEGDDDGYAVVTVQDRGIGIPAAELPHIFERFYRASNTGGRPGSGIGLAGSRDIVRQHGGTLEVASHEGAGSTFTMRLPLAPPHESED